MVDLIPHRPLCGLGKQILADVQLGKYPASARTPAFCLGAPQAPLSDSMLAGRHLQPPKAGQLTQQCYGLPSRCCEGGPSTSGRHTPSQTNRPHSRSRTPVRCSVAAPDRPDVKLPGQSARASAAAASPLLCDPDSFTLGAGELSTMAAPASPHPADVFRCSGCTLEECQVMSIANSSIHASSQACIRCCYLQVPAGCAKMQWRRSLDGYLRQILNARVYDVAV